MYKLALVLILSIAGLAQTIAAQDPPRHTIVVSGVYGRSDVDFKSLQNEDISFNPARDGIGGEVTWHYRPTGVLIVGATGGVLLHNKDTAGTYSCGTGCTVTTQGISKVQRAYFQYEMGVQKRTGGFQPGIAGVAGLHRGNFGGVTYTPNGNFVKEGGTEFYVGAKGWFDLDLHKRKVFLRPGLQVTKNLGADVNRFDVQASVGLAFKF